MSTVKINSISELETLVSDLKTKVTTSLNTNITSINSTLNSISNYSNNGFAANIGDISSSLASDFSTVSSNFSNSEENYTDYTACIKEFNTDDYGTTATQNGADENGDTTLVTTNDSDSGNKNNSGGGKSSHRSSHSSSSDSDGYTGVVTIPTNPEEETEETEEVTEETEENILETYLDSVEGEEVATDETVEATTTSIDLSEVEDIENINFNTMLIMSNSETDEKGLKTFKDRYIVSVPASYGKIGDLIDIKQPDGTVIKCIIGSIQESTDSPAISFVVDQEKFTGELSTIHPDWLNSNVSIVNKGNYFEYLNIYDASTTNNGTEKTPTTNQTGTKDNTQIPEQLESETQNIAGEENINPTIEETEEALD